MIWSLHTILHASFFSIALPLIFLVYFFFLPSVLLCLFVFYDDFLKTSRKSLDRGNISGNIFQCFSRDQLNSSPSPGRYMSRLSTMVSGDKLLLNFTIYCPKTLAFQTLFSWLFPVQVAFLGQNKLQNWPDFQSEDKKVWFCWTTTVIMWMCLRTTLNLLPSNMGNDHLKFLQ